MSIEIRELVVRATVTKSIGKKENRNGLSNDDIRLLKKEILSDCKDWVKDYLKELKSR